MPTASTRDDAWIYHLPAFLDRVRGEGDIERGEGSPDGERGGTTREQGVHAIGDEIGLDIGGVLYHHRGARLPAYDATFLWREDTFELQLDAVGPRSAWFTFDAARSWDFFIYRAPGDEPCLAWMSDAEFREDESGRFDRKAEAIGMDRFSFGIYLHAPRTWDAVEERARATDAPVFIHQPDGQTYIPEEWNLEELSKVLPEELRPNDESPPDYLGVRRATIDTA